MDQKSFFSHYPERKKDSNKYDNGVVAFLSGSYGMAGAAYYNLIGARSVGASYVHSYLPDSIYPIVATNEMSAVYHPYNDSKTDIFPQTAFNKLKAIGVGSGINNLPHQKKYLEYIINFADIPTIVDAQGLKILSENDELFSYSDKLILTPHLGEFSILSGLSTDQIMKDRVNIASKYAKEKGVILVLKGPETLVVSKEGEVHVNDSGNEVLARAGSGDVLCGMLTGMCALYEDPYQACIDGVWLHGHLADVYAAGKGTEIFDLSLYPTLAADFFGRR